MRLLCDRCCAETHREDKFCPSCGAEFDSLSVSDTLAPLKPSLIKKKQHGSMAKPAIKTKPKPLKVGIVSKLHKKKANDSVSDASDTVRFTADDFPIWKSQIESLLKDVPYVNVRMLMGSLNISLSIDPKNEWQNGIFENSTYMKLLAHADGTVACVTQYGMKPNFRKTTFIYADDLARKILKYLQPFLDQKKEKKP